MSSYKDHELAKARRIVREAGVDLDGPAIDVCDALYDWACQHDDEIDDDPSFWAEAIALEILY